MEFLVGALIGVFIWFGLMLPACDKIDAKLERDHKKYIEDKIDNCNKRGGQIIEYSGTLGCLLPKIKK